MYSLSKYMKKEEELKTALINFMGGAAEKAITKESLTEAFGTDSKEAKAILRMLTEQGLIKEREE